MRRIDWDRWAPLTGIVFVALIVVTFFVPTASPPSADDPAADVVAWFDKHETALLTSGFLSGLALVFFVWFLGSLHRRLRDGGEPRLAVVAFGGGLLLAAVALLGIATQQYLAWGLAQDLDAETVRALWLLGFGGLAYAFPLVVLVEAVAVASIRSGVFPRWYAGLAFLAGLWFAVGGAAYAGDGFFSPTGAYGFIGFLAFLVWVLVTSVLLLTRQEQEQRATTRAAPAM
ncbi:MAG TPA: hypothetical protein VNK94_12575 [Gaiellaceae bacterium]|nr:hypothetical protein [Gaiellaceae bacterium]